MQLFLALFEMYPHLLQLFPFKDEAGKPVIAELKVHGLKVASTLGEMVERLANVDTLDRWVVAAVVGVTGPSLALCMISKCWASSSSYTKHRQRT